MPGLKRRRAMDKDEAAKIIARNVRARLSKPSITPKFKMVREITGPFPPRRRAKLNYVTRFLATPVPISGGCTTFQYSANGLFDPQIALGGIQPYGFDQWMGMYTRYTVVSAVARFTVAASDSEYYTGACGVNLAPSGGPIVTSTTTAISSEYSNWRTWTQNGTAPTVTVKFDTAKYFGMKDVMDEFEVSGTDAANPLRQAYFNCWIAADDPTNVHQLACTLVITYDVYFHE